MLLSPPAPVVGVGPVEHHVEQVEGGGQPDDDEDDQAPVQLVLPPD